MQGNLERTSLPEVLLNLHLAKRHGILRLSRNEVKKSIYLVEGEIVFAHSNQKHDRLGETLLRLGKITQEEFENASREVIEKGKRLGQVLSQLGYISAQEVNTSVHYQLQQIIFSLFDWDSGDYEFLERDRPVYEDIMIDISTPTLIMEGVRNITNREVLVRSYQENEKQILYLHSGSPRLPRTELYFGEETILACVDGSKTIDNVRQLSRLSEMEFERSVYGLLLCGLLHLGKEIASQEIPQKPGSGALRSEPVQRHSPYATQPMGDKEASQLRTLSESEMRKLVQATSQKFAEATDEEVLGVLPDCSAAEVNQAYDALIVNFQSPFYSLDRYLDLKDPLKAILDRAASAHEHLIAKIGVRKPLSEVQFESTPAASAMPATDPPAAQEHVKKDSIADLQEKIRKEPGNAALLRRLGRRLYETGKPQESEKQYLKALELEPQSVDNHLALAEFYTSMGLKLKAFKHLNIVLQLQPNHERALEMLNLKKSRKPLYEI
jgi:hypothetical protein